MLQGQTELYSEFFPISQEDWYIGPKLSFLWEERTQRRIQRRRTGRASPCLKIFKEWFWKFWLHNTHKSSYWNQHAMFTICISFSILTKKKSIGYVWRGIKTIPRPKQNIACGTAPPVLKLSQNGKFEAYNWLKTFILLYSWYTLSKKKSI